MYKKYEYVNKFPNILTFRKIVLEKMWFVIDVNNEFINDVIEIIDLINEEFETNMNYKSIFLLTTLVRFITPFMKLDKDTEIKIILKKINFILLRQELRDFLEDIKLKQCYENIDKILKFVPLKEKRIRIEI